MHGLYCMVDSRFKILWYFQKSWIIKKKKENGFRRKEVNIYETVQIPLQFTSVRDISNKWFFLQKKCFIFVGNLAEHNANLSIYILASKIDSQQILIFCCLLQIMHQCSEIIFLLYHITVLFKLF